MGAGPFFGGINDNLREGLEVFVNLVDVFRSKSRECNQLSSISNNIF